jgi:hypothetical protein
VARAIDLTPRFRARLDALGVQRGSEASKAIGATIAALANDSDLPGPGDTLAATPPVGTTETRLVLFSLQRRPPVPLDPELA